MSQYHSTTQLIQHLINLLVQNGDEFNELK